MPRLIPTAAQWNYEERGGVAFYSRQTDGGLAFAESVAQSLGHHPRWLNCGFLYDAAGSALFEAITEQPEYYQTRTEDQILARHADEIRDLVGDQTLVELGSGSSTKTKRLVEAWLRRGSARYIPIDVSRAAITGACDSLHATYPDLQVEGVVGTYEHGLSLCREISPLTLVFLGSTIGNFNQQEAHEFFHLLSASLGPGDCFLLGIDLVKDPRTLEAAYNDRAGHSAAFTRNLFARMNRELRTDIPLDAVEHVAYYNDRLQRIEIFARFNRAVNIHIPHIERTFRLAAGEMVHTEISRKFRVGDMAASVARFGFRQLACFTDAEQKFGVLLFQRQTETPTVEDRRAQLGNRLQRQRQRTLELVAPLSEADMRQQHSPLMSPIVWDLGHIANFEQLWLVRAVDRAVAGTDEPCLNLRPPEHRRNGEQSDAQQGAEDRLYNADATPRAKRGELNIPSLSHTLGRMREVREQTQARLNTAELHPSHPLTSDALVYNLVYQHEAWHQETILQALQLRTDLYYRPFNPERTPPPRPDLVPQGEILVPAGPLLMGSDQRPSTYDNERPQHWRECEAFFIDTVPLTNGKYLRFIEDGGYRQEKFWCEDGWRWVQENCAQAPAHWSKSDRGWQVCNFGRWTSLDSCRPVMHVSWFEADAYSRWAGKRLPTETEWEKAAAWDASTMSSRTFPWGEETATPEFLNFNQRLLEPAPIGCYPRGRSFYGCHQMLGDVWEWTSSIFAPYPGFEPFPYPEYSAAFFDDGYRVLRGGSWATTAALLRTTLRGWDYPQRRQIFSGFRCARDA